MTRLNLLGRLDRLLSHRPQAALLSPGKGFCMHTLTRATHY